MQKLTLERKMEQPSLGIEMVMDMHKHTHTYTHTHSFSDSFPLPLCAMLSCFNHV